MLPPIAPLTNPKQLLRERMKGERRAAARARPDAARHAAGNFLTSIDIAPGAVVSVYDPIGDELDVEPLVAALADNGVTLALPAVVQKNSPLAFRRWTPGDGLTAEAFGARTPGPEAGEVEPDIVVTPLLAFTRQGGRLGYGGGYYDRTLQALRAKKTVLAVGYAYGAQELEQLPLGKHDEPLDWVVTERSAVKCR